MSGSQHGGGPVGHHECDKILSAGRTLIEKSHLASYQNGAFVACTNCQVFECRVKADFHQRFGRYMAWVWFAVGAENLAKAACLCNGCPEYSPEGHYGALEKFIRWDKQAKKYVGHLVKLATHLPKEDRPALLNGYLKLRDIRNRDLHTFKEDVRKGNFPLVESHFVPAFNVLLGTMQVHHPEAEDQ